MNHRKRTRTMVKHRRQSRVKNARSKISIWCVPSAAPMSTEGAAKSAADKSSTAGAVGANQSKAEDSVSPSSLSSNPIGIDGKSKPLDSQKPVEPPEQTSAALNQQPSANATSILLPDQNSVQANSANSPQEKTSLQFSPNGNPNVKLLDGPPATSSLRELNWRSRPGSLRQRRTSKTTKRIKQLKHLRKLWCYC